MHLQGNVFSQLGELWVYFNQTKFDSDCWNSRNKYQEEFGFTVTSLNEVRFTMTKLRFFL